MTNEQKARAIADFELIAKEPIQFEKMGGFYYCFGSELATLRIFKKMIGTKGLKHEFSHFKGFCVSWGCL